MAPDPTVAAVTGARLRRADGTLSRRSLRGVLISAPGADEPLLVTTPGEVVWSLLEEPSSRAELVAALADAFGEDPTVVAADIEPVLKSLLAVGALVEDWD